MHAKFWLLMMYAFFRAVAAIPAKKLVDPSPYLRSNGFVCRSRKLSRRGMLKTELYVAALKPLCGGPDRPNLSASMTQTT